jgi:tRNA G46 methylase TrmB
MDHPAPSPRRSAFADKLAPFADFTFADAAAFTHRGRWFDFFRRHRIGPAFTGRIVFEIGCADADSLARIAAKHPATAFVGLDWKYRALHTGAARVAELGLRNVALLRARAQDIARIFADREIDEIWIFHPDPCDRDVELKNRLIAEPFLLDAHRTLRDDASLLALKTDHPGYYQWTLALLGLPAPAWFSPDHPVTPASPRTRRRDLMRQEDLPAPSDAIRRHFDVAANSPDFWNDPAALAHTAPRPFANEVTFFESRFLKKRLPIYYIEMRKR